MQSCNKHIATKGLESPGPKPQVLGSKFWFLTPGPKSLPDSWVLFKFWVLYKSWVLSPGS